MRVDGEHVMPPASPRFGHRRAGAPLVLSSPSLAANRRGEERRREEEGEEKEKERLTGPDVEPLVVKSGKTQIQGRSAAPGTPRLDAYNGRSFTIPSTSIARRTVSSLALCDPSRSVATHGCRSNTSTPLNLHKSPIPLVLILSV
uniref:Uncharacterized protein n=1 Tax=Oryza glumipatula TaxID=40148 RepID=A0A0E0BJK3_9ORYZ